MGNPASDAKSAIFNALSDVSSAGLTTMLLPAASAGAHFHASINAGKFHGGTAATTPTGSRKINPSASAPRRRNAVVELVGVLGVPAKGRDGLRHVDFSTVRDRLSGLQAVELRELFRVGLEQIREAEEDPLSLLRRHARPGSQFKDPPPGPDRGVDIVLLALSNLTELLARRRIEGREGPPRTSIDELSVDKGLRVHSTTGPGSAVPTESPDVEVTVSSFSWATPTRRPVTCQDGPGEIVRSNM